MTNSREIDRLGNSFDRRALVRRKVDRVGGYPGHGRFWERALSRRQFIRATGAATGPLLSRGWDTGFR